MDRKTEFETACERVASDFFFTGKSDIEARKLEYRKGKNIEDVRRARINAIKNGRFKTELELEFFAINLKSVFKLKKEVKS